MTITTEDTVKALLELSKTLPDPQGFLRAVRDGLIDEVGGGGTLSVTIVTPSGNAGDLRASVEDMLTQKLGRPVEITERADPSIIGGAIVTFGDEQIDMSVRGALQQAASAITTSAS